MGHTTIEQHVAARQRIERRVATHDDIKRATNAILLWLAIGAVLIVGMVVGASFLLAR